MINEKNYKRAFSSIHSERTFLIREDALKRSANRKKHLALQTIIVMICGLILTGICGATVAYAGNIGGFRDFVKVKILGEVRDVGIVQQDGEDTYHFFVIMPDGVRADYYIPEGDGTDPQELHYFNDVYKNQKGQMWLMYMGETIELTAHPEFLDNDGNYRLQLRGMYFIVSPDGSYSSSAYGYDEITEN